jgi:protein PhnA
MAKGYELHQARAIALQGLGKDLVRRAKSKCELTGESGVPLRPYEVPPHVDAPSLDRTILVSESCLAALDRPRTLAGQTWRCLTETVWSEIPAVQVVAWRMLHVLAKKEDWARDALEGVFLDPEVQEWAEQEPLEGT